MPQVAITPSIAQARALQRGGPPLQRLWAGGAEGVVAQAGLRGSGQFQGVALVVVPAAQVDGVALPAALRHPHDIDEEA